MHLKFNTQLSTELSQAHSTRCRAPSTVTIPEDGGSNEPLYGDNEDGGDNEPTCRSDEDGGSNGPVCSDNEDQSDNVTPATPQPTTEGDPEVDHTLTTQAEGGEIIIRDSKMQKYGFFINTEWRLAICTMCHSGIGADQLHRHLKKDLKQFSLNISKSYCQSIITQYHLLHQNDLRALTSIPPAIYGLPVRPTMSYCSSCGYAAQAHSSVIRHQVAGCQPSLVVLGFAQAFFPKTNQGFFAVKVPPEETYEPDVPTPISCHFKAKFALQLTAN